mmetsp:Transcript_37723/g.36179  ORF Transcript_37723/g.36179 Transcript_37723/m.36179 type:complete len:140 (-) Transcript_37723:63-482(-)|eukprot:CAMPEP_0170541960 /NCGR_PEP_ID=MMETSP0211-20121228/1540_1 /TAXON_ID=311385 /ORGANISM="Pseudokeronopsis sp., Strain OXSARD2" /LENGTH=139 /DNA_ID=CAMNT_0010844875 /DNA_START=285 /DNA_END=704 /DNA_ORIENTATION=-
MPKAEIYDPTGQQIGLIIQNYCPAIYCTYQLEIYNGSEANEFNLFRKFRRCALNCHTCCSVGWCGMCCNELDFDVTDSMGNSKETLKKVHSGCYNECFTASDKYQISLPTNERDAALFLAGVQMLDMLFFENPYAFLAP